MTHPLSNYIKKNTDKYFSHTAQIAKHNYNAEVIYAVFLRHPCIFACQAAIHWLNTVKQNLNININIVSNYTEGDFVAAGDPLFFIQGNFAELAELETLLLQKVGLSCLCAWTAYYMCTALPKVSFISMLARHMANPEMVDLCEYGVAVGSNAAKKNQCIGFIGASTDSTSHYFNAKQGLGTMPHALIGYAGSTLNAAKMYYNTISNQQITILVDYFGKEITDTLEVCNYFKSLAHSGNLTIRLDTHGGRFLQGLNTHKSYEIIEKYSPNALHDYQDKKELDMLIGMGVSAASIFYTKEQLLKHGFNKVKIVASSGFNLQKCRLMAKVNAPIDIIGTGSTLPASFSDSYATADIICYNNVFTVKQGREYLITKYKESNNKF